MADKNPVQNLCSEMTCSICLEYFKDPVMTDCGHNFCQACITQYMRDPMETTCCPQCGEPCQQRNFRLNRQLASIVEIVQNGSLQVVKGTEAQGPVCERHQEPLKLFCEDDHALICLVCDKSRDHREHKVIPKEDAFAEYKSKIWTHMEYLKEERNKLLFSKLSEETKRQKLLEQTETERQKIVAEFKQLHQFLDENELLLLAQLKDLDSEIKDSGNEKIASLSEEISSIGKLIKEMEEKHNQTENEFFQDIRSTLERCIRKKAIELPCFIPLVEERTISIPKIHLFLETAMKEFKDTVLAGPQQKKAMTTKDMTIPTLVFSTEDLPAVHLQSPPSTTELQTSLKPFQAQETVWNFFKMPIQLQCWSCYGSGENTVRESFLGSECRG